MDFQHLAEGAVGALFSCLMFTWYISSRLTKMETKLDLLMEGRELVKVRTK